MDDDYKNHNEKDFGTFWLGIPSGFPEWGQRSVIVIFLHIRFIMIMAFLLLLLITITINLIIFTCGATRSPRDNVRPRWGRDVALATLIEDDFDDVEEEEDEEDNTYDDDGGGVGVGGGDNDARDKEDIYDANRSHTNDVNEYSVGDGDNLFDDDGDGYNDVDDDDDVGDDDDDDDSDGYNDVGDDVCHLNSNIPSGLLQKLTPVVLLQTHHHHHGFNHNSLYHL